MRCEPPQFHPGGGGINVSRAVKKLGGESTAIFTAGGGTGQMLNQLLEADVVYARDFVDTEQMTGDQLKHLALLAL